jgi:lanthionine synthetase-like protein
MEERHIPNTLDPLTLKDEPETLLRSALQRILNSSPPQSNYTKAQLGGILRGHTGIAYLFLQVYASLPRLQIHGYSSLHWAQAYISGQRPGPLALEPGNCGLGSECLSHPAVKACITKDLNDVRSFLSSLPQILAPARPARQSSAEGMDVDADAASLDPFPSDLLSGRAGTLYLLRLIRHWVPHSAPLVELYIVHLTERILATDDDGHGNWLFSGERYIGAAHGDIGIITQLIVTTPPLAPRLESKLESLLDLQLPDGNWPSTVPYGPDDASPQKPKADLIQWCHGAPGVILSLLSLRPFFPKLWDKIDITIEKGRQLTWEKGLLRKEPSLCHGILGNAL